ncbi:hypothetical protein C8Q74DRAFT_1305414 [Fomes fomentarius]|nr:hypothetical protein C8Q74DRAFT_1305414 [Fomes fomentarius]
MMEISRMANIRPLLRTDPVKAAMPAFSAYNAMISEEDQRGMRLDGLMRSLDQDQVVHLMASPQTGRSTILDDAVYKALRDRLSLEGSRYKGDGSGLKSSCNNPRVLSRLVTPSITLSIGGLLYKCQRRSAGESIHFQDRYLPTIPSRGISILR